MVENRSGKMSNQPRKIGTTPIQSKDIDFEFDISGQVDAGHVMTIEKTRCKALDGMTFPSPGKEFADILMAWLTDGAPLPETGDQKVSRVMAAKPEEMTKIQLSQIIAREFGEHIKSPRFLSSEQCDLLISMIQSQAA